METEVNGLHNSQGDPGDEQSPQFVTPPAAFYHAEYPPYPETLEKVPNGPAAPKKLASPSDEEWHFHTLMVVKHLTWLHRANQFNMPIDCPAGDATTCPRCLLLAELQTALDEAELEFMFIGARK